MVTGVVGAAGGVGGFFLPSILGLAKEFTGSFGPGLATFALLASFAGAMVMLRLKRESCEQPTALEPAA